MEFHWQPHIIRTIYIDSSVPCPRDDRREREIENRRGKCAKQGDTFNTIYEERGGARPTTTTQESSRSKDKSGAGQGEAAGTTRGHEKIGTKKRSLHAREAVVRPWNQVTT